MGCQSFSTWRDDAPSGASSLSFFFSLEKKTTLQDRMKVERQVELPWAPFSYPWFFEVLAHNSIKKPSYLSKFLFTLGFPNFMLKNGHKDVCLFSYLPLSSPTYFLQTAGYKGISSQQLAVRRRQLLRLLKDLNKIRLKNKRFSWVGSPVFLVLIVSY